MWKRWTLWELRLIRGRVWGRGWAENSKGTTAHQAGPLSFQTSLWQLENFKPSKRIFKLIRKSLKPTVKGTTRVHQAGTGPRCLEISRYNLKISIKLQHWNSYLKLENVKVQTNERRLVLVRGQVLNKQVYKSSDKKGGRKKTCKLFERNQEMIEQKILLSKKTSFHKDERETEMKRHNKPQAQFWERKFQIWILTGELQKGQNLTICWLILCQPTN